MRIALAYNERTSDDVHQGELLTAEEVETLRKAIASLGHDVTPIEVSGNSDHVVEALVSARPELVFNVAEGVNGEGREARYPAIYESLGLAYTGGNPALLHIDLDKRLAGKILALRGVRVPRAAFVTPDAPELPDDTSYPVLIKPNYEGSSMGITRDSIAEDKDEAADTIARMLEDFPEGLVVEQFIRGRELTVPMLEAWPGRFLEIVEHVIDNDEEYMIFDYHTKHGEGSAEVQTICPPELTPAERREVLVLADRVDQVMRCPDMGRIDMRLENGKPYFLEVNPIPRLMHNGSLIVAAKHAGLDYEEVFDLIIRSAARRHGLSLAPAPVPAAAGEKQRPTARELGITVGHFDTGAHNAITDVEGLRVGHVTHVEDDVPIPGEDGVTSVRTGITAICPKPETLFHEHMVAGAFVLNGIGEMSGIVQAQEWGWVETPILLTNTMSVGRVHDGIIRHLVQRFPELGREVDVTIPLVGETNDAFLNDVRVTRNSPEDAMKAITTAQAGAVEQGSVGGGTGMLSFDFAGGIGTSSRVIPGDSPGSPGFTVGVLVQANFGRMRNLTVDGHVVGRELDDLYPYDTRRENSYGSAIVVVATDAPLLTQQLNRLAKRAALGLGRVGSHAASTSGEIVFAFSTGNQVTREAKRKARMLNLSYVTDEHINPLYESVIEATEEAVLNAMFCSAGQTGRFGRYAPPVPSDKIVELLRGGSPVHRETVRLHKEAS